MELTGTAYAKLNLSLDIIGKRSDGYHEMDMVMQSISLSDSVTLQSSEETGVSAVTGRDDLPSSGDNIAVKAYRAFFVHMHRPCPDAVIRIEKHIPVCAGMAGGSSDGAAVLRLLRDAYAPAMSRDILESIAAEIGSDVPFCVRGGTALCKGRGELMEDLPSLPHCHIVLCKPDFPISTPALFAQVDQGCIHHRPDTDGMLRALNEGDLEGIAARLSNVFEDVLPRKYSEIAEIKKRMLAMGAMNAAMTGSGPTVFGIFRDRGASEDAAARLHSDYTDVFCAEPTGTILR